MSPLDFQKLLREKFKFPLAIVGTGISAKSSIKVLECIGFKNGHDFCVLDEKPNATQVSPAQFQDHQTMLEKFKPQSLLVSPGFPLSKDWIKKFLSQNSESLLSELSLAALFLSSEKVIGVTGSLGKSTTVSLIGEGFRAQYPATFVGGNLGIPLCDYVYEVLIGQRPRAEFLVLELSSFQLENLEFIKFDAAAITYLSSNHLERYSSIDEYYKTKWSLIQKTKGSLFLNLQSPDLKFYSEKHPSPQIQGVSALTFNKYGLTLDSAELVGDHNKDNIRLAWELLDFFKIDKVYFKKLLQYKGLPHRLEYLGTSPNGVHCINDSKATALESVISGVLATLSDSRFNKGTLHLLIGGRDKNLPWVMLKSLYQKPRVSFSFFGESGNTIKNQTGIEGDYYEKLENAVSALSQIAKKTDTILLSPGGTSLDEFKNFEDRGHKFEIYCQEYFKLKAREILKK